MKRFGLVEVWFGKVETGLVGLSLVCFGWVCFGLIKAGVIWLNLIRFCQSTDKQTKNKYIFNFNEFLFVSLYFDRKKRKKRGTKRSVYRVAARLKSLRLLHILSRACTNTQWLLSRVTPVQRTYSVYHKNTSIVVILFSSDWVFLHWSENSCMVFGTNFHWSWAGWLGNADFVCLLEIKLSNLGDVIIDSEWLHCIYSIFLL